MARDAVIKVSISSPTMKTAPIHKDDKDVLRKYFEAAPTKAFSELTRACIRFVRYKEKVPCAVCDKQSKKHWTCVVRFKAANFDDQPFVLKLRGWFKAGTPVCEAHPMQPDEKEFLRKVRGAQRQKKG